MTTALTIQADYGVDADKKCSGVLFEIPSLEIIGGDVIDLRLWGMSHAALTPYNIRQGINSLGAGQLLTMPNQPIYEEVGYGGSISALTDWYITNVASIIVKSPNIVDDQGAVWAIFGENVTAKFTWINNVLTTFDNTIITGAVDIIYESSQDVQTLVDFYDTNDYQAEWPIDSIGRVYTMTPLLVLDAATGSVTEYAAIDQDVTHLFVRNGYSCIRVKDGTKLYGTVQVQYTRSPFYKLWQWTVPIGKQGQYWFFIYKNSLVTNKFSIELPDLTSGIPVPRNVSMFVKARTSQIPVPDAEVYIGGVLYGNTNLNGQIDINGILTGTYSLKIIAPGFTPTDQDNLFNDEITIY